MVDDHIISFTLDLFLKIFLKGLPSIPKVFIPIYFSLLFTYQMRLGTHKYCNIVSFDMEDDISPVNPLEDKFLVAFSNITSEDNCSF